jgi:hypothetical protein
MSDVGIAGLAELTPVPLLRQVIATLQEFGVDLRVRGPVYRQQGFENGLDGGRALRHHDASRYPVADPAAMRAAGGRFAARRRPGWRNWAG